MYGQGDLTQAFCHCAAVCGALQVLVCPYTFLMCALHENGWMLLVQGIYFFQCFVKAFRGFECSLRSAHWGFKLCILPSFVGSADARQRFSCWQGTKYILLPLGFKTRVPGTTCLDLVCPLLTTLIGWSRKLRITGALKQSQGSICIVESWSLALLSVWDLCHQDRLKTEAKKRELHSSALQSMQAQTLSYYPTGGT